LTIFDFPRGAKAGTCLHEIFEILDYTLLSSHTISSAVRNSLLSNGFQEQWLPAVSHMVAKVTSANIIPDSSQFSLSKLQKGDWQTEMEFYLPISQLNPDNLQKLFKDILDRELFEDFFAMLDRLSFRQSRGMLQGFIDLVFVHEGRYFILDWKSNHLGMNKSYYDQKTMHESMCHNAYVLQYHLYSLALDRLLKVRLPDYSYEQHFGGAIYLYLRGISEDSGMNGIYFDRPRPEFIRHAEEILFN
jgi:exodeoxyribonuclease V beta subunit